MKRLNFRWLAKALLAVVVVCAVSIAVSLQHPLFGKLPESDRLTRILRSPNHANGVFRNELETPLLTTEDSQLSIMLSNALNKVSPRPPSVLPTVKTGLKSLDAAQDLVVWLGHSSYYVQLGGQRILIDPVFSTNAAPVPLANRAFDGTNLYTAEDMPDVDFLLITHDHYDHLDYPTIQALQPKVRRVITGLGVGAHFESWGYDMRIVHEADWNEMLQLTPGLNILVTPARHFSGRTFTRDQSLWVGFALFSPQRHIFFSGDSGYAPHFARIGQEYGPFDWVALDAGQYDPRWTNVHMNPEQAAQATDDLRAKAFTPAHIGRFSLSPHDWDDPFKRVTAASRGRSYALWTPEIGRVIHLDGREQAFTRWWENVRR